MKRILNAETLTSHGNIEGRKAVLEILEAGLQAADPYNNTFAAMRVEGDRLIMGGKDFIPLKDPRADDEVIDLKEIGRIYVTDYTTFADAVTFLKKWDAWDVVPASVREHLSRADASQETPKAADFQHMRFRIFEVSPESLSMMKVARKKAMELGFKPHLLYDNCNMQAEASQVGRVVSNIAYHTEIDGVSQWLWGYAL